MSRASLILFMLSLCLSTTVFALISDHHEKILISADTTNYNYKTGLTIYEGHVIATQGSTRITADKLTTKTNHNGHSIQEAIAYGLTGIATYSTIPKAGSPPMHAEAKTIKFYPTHSNITLEQNVSISQGENSFQGQLILYNRDDQTIIVPASTKGQAVLVYDPDEKRAL